VLGVGGSCGDGDRALSSRGEERLVPRIDRVVTAGALESLASGNRSADAEADERVGQQPTLEPSLRKRWTPLPFLLLHLAGLAVFVVPPTPTLLGWCVGSYLLRMFGVTAGYHRYFSHRAFSLSRGWQATLAVLAETSGQKGVLWWAAHHRHHHLHSDTASDVHSPVRRGFWWAHVGWILSPDYDTYDQRRVSDFARFPELVWLDCWYMVPFLAYGAALFALGGLPVFVWGFVVSTLLLYHATFLINSLAHVWGSRPYDTTDDSRNNFWLAVLTLGEGWHNNHHHYRSSARQGVRWWEIDVTYYVLVALSWVGITRSLRPFRDVRRSQ
jgi:stearoyl-CoA desaturase (delta-9 desaturase)